jgi:hypothetical protein
MKENKKSFHLIDIVEEEPNAGGQGKGMGGS